ncbi:NEDD4-binding protein 2-like 2 isoform X1 [Ascaphus truei]|uniref:NEDD4-binding protein 2-like 2 isoform X1 n=2 Tax=Ascaphus truei TaxID=8439 RepID=UPI003F5A982A
MWWDHNDPVGSGLGGGFEMPHAEKKATSQYEHDSSVEPCSKKLKPEFSASWSCTNVAKQKEESEKQHDKWSFFPVSGEDNHYEKSKNEGTTVNEDFKYDTQVTLTDFEGNFGFKSETSLNRSFKSPDNGKDYETDERPSKSESATASGLNYSETSTAFIGPIFQPRPKVGSRTKGVPKKDSVSTSSPTPCYKIRTVELEKSPSRETGKHEMDFELCQFYKELEKLETEPDDQAVSVKESEHNDHLTQDPFFSASNSDNGSTLLVENTSTPHHSNETFYGEQMGWRELSLFHKSIPPPPFLNNTMPPSGFQSQPPPPFIIPYGPPPATYNYPLSFPRQDTPLYKPYPQNEDTIDHCDGYYRHYDPDHWNNLHIPQNSKDSDQRSSFKTPPLETVPGNEQQEHKIAEASGNKDRCLDIEFSHQVTGVSHEQCPDDDDDDENNRDNMSCNGYKKKLILLRGVPGSGKSTLAHDLLDPCPDGIVLSTDDYFCQEEGYTYDVKLLGDAHDWNQNRAKSAMDDGRSPVIIDNTNIMSWEMKPYVQMAIERDYIVEFLEPDTWWKLDPMELEKRNKHGVPREKISQMLDRFEHHMTISAVMNSVEPPHRSAKTHPPQPGQRWGTSVDLSDHSNIFHNR